MVRQEYGVLGRKFFLMVRRVLKMRWITFVRLLAVAASSREKQLRGGI